MGKEVEETEKGIRTFREACTGHAVKATLQRVEIYRELKETEGHPDAETIFRRVRKRIPTISLDTVYRTLRLFEKKGLISRVEALDEKARFDANTQRHHHFVCTACGFVGDVYCDAWNDLKPPKGVERIGKVLSVHVELRGFCKKCEGRSSPTSL